MPSNGALKVTANDNLKGAKTSIFTSKTVDASTGKTTTLSRNDQGATKTSHNLSNNSVHIGTKNEYNFNTYVDKRPGQAEKQTGISTPNVKDDSHVTVDVTAAKAFVGMGLAVGLIAGMALANPRSRNPGRGLTAEEREQNDTSARRLEAMQSNLRARLLTEN